MVREHEPEVVLILECCVSPIQELLFEGAELLLEFLFIVDQFLEPIQYSIAFDGGTDGPAPVFEFDVGHRHIRVQYSIDAEVIMLQLEEGPLILRHFINLIIVIFLLRESQRLLVVSDGFFEFAFLEVLIARVLTVVHCVYDVSEGA